MKKQKSLNNKGFSLVELIIVIAIMAILIGVLAPNLLRYVERTNISADTQVADSLRTAVMTAIMDPVVINATNSGVPNPAAAAVTLVWSSNGVPPAAPNDPANNFSGAFGQSVAETLGFANAPAMVAALNSDGLLDELRSAGDGGGAMAFQVVINTDFSVTVTILNSTIGDTAGTDIVVG